jgi:hypothetical protein
MHTFYAVANAVVKAVLAAVISKSIDYLLQFVGIAFIISPASAAAAAAAAKRSLFSANAAQQRHNFACNQQLAYCRATIPGSAMRAVRWSLEQKIRGKVKKQNTTQNP